MFSGCEVLINGCGIRHVLWTQAWFSRSMASYSYESMVRGYHIYKKIWEAVDGEVPQCKRERRNWQDPLAWLCVGGIKVKFHDKTITHEYSKIKSLRKFIPLRYNYIYLLPLKTQLLPGNYTNL